MLRCFVTKLCKFYSFQSALLKGKKWSLLILLEWFESLLEFWSSVFYVLNNLSKSSGQHVERCHNAAIRSHTVLFHDFFVLYCVSDINVCRIRYFIHCWIKINNIGWWLLCMKVGTDPLQIHSRYMNMNLHPKGIII